METNNSQLVIYQTPQGDTRIDVRVKGGYNLAYAASDCGAVWDKSTAISKHLKNIFASGELQGRYGYFQNGNNHSTWRNVRKDSDKRNQFYNLDAILSVGYRVQLQKRHSIPYLGESGIETVSLARLRHQRAGYSAEVRRVEPVGQGIGSHNTESGETDRGQSFVARCCCRLHIRTRHTRTVTITRS